MNHPDLPSQYELCRIAAALLYVDAANRPVKAIQAALGLWLAAGFELPKARERDLYDNAVAYSGQGGAEEDRQSNQSLADYIEFYELDEAVKKREAPGKILFGTSEQSSEAMKWANSHVESEKDGFKTFRHFDKSWDDVFGGEAAKYRENCREAVLQRFLDARVKRRRDADAARKRKKRHLEKRRK